MNRRQFITAAAPSLGVLLANNRLALAQVQSVATPVSTEPSKPEVDLNAFPPEEVIYLGVLTTWLELLEFSIDGLYVGLDAVEEDMESIAAKSQMFMPLGVWSYLAQDTEQFEGPGAFALVHRFAVSTFAHLGNAADIIATGLISDSPTAVTLGTEHINLASDELGKLLAALPFDRPRREEFFTPHS